MARLRSLWLMSPSLPPVAQSRWARRSFRPTASSLLSRGRWKGLLARRFRRTLPSSAAACWTARTASRRKCGSIPCLVSGARGPCAVPKRADNACGDLFRAPLEITSSSRGGMSGFKRAAGAGGFSRMALKTTAVVAPRKGTAPVAISYSTAPKLKRSLRTSRVSPRACSGDMYATVPTAVPALVRSTSFTDGESIVSSDGFVPRVASDVARICLANPKSKILAWPRSVMNKFAGLMSR